MANPGDFKATDDPLQPEWIEHKGLFGHHRLLLRVSFWMNDGMFVPLTFVLDTAAPGHFYLGRPAVRALQTGGRLQASDMGAVLEFAGTRALVQQTPSSHAPANILGLKMLKIIGFHCDKKGFGFDMPFDYF